MTSRAEVAALPHTGWTTLSLACAAMVYTVVAVIPGPLLLFITWEQIGRDPSLAAPMLLIGGVSLVVGLGMAAANLAVAMGLRAGRTWAWWGAMALAMLYLSSSFLPFALGIGIPLLRKQARTAYGIGF